MYWESEMLRHGSLDFWSPFQMIFFLCLHAFTSGSFYKYSTVQWPSVLLKRITGNAFFLCAVSTWPQYIFLYWREMPSPSVPKVLQPLSFTAATPEYTNVDVHMCIHSVCINHHELLEFCSREIMARSPCKRVLSTLTLEVQHFRVLLWRNVVRNSALLTVNNSNIASGRIQSVL